MDASGGAAVAPAVARERRAGCHGQRGRAHVSRQLEISWVVVESCREVAALPGRGGQRSAHRSLPDC